jgi:1-acyl-sn-glycerol-3-phosphate acyltransferase
VNFCIKNLIQVDGLENLTGLDPDRGVLLVANHRTFFDLYVITSELLRNSSWVTEMYFPVRSTFFYERVEGIAVNALMSALAMYPPILRESSKRAFNQYAVEVLAEVSRRPGTVVGVHPEGTRGKGPDPYELLPAQPGVGQMAHSARSIVVPAFTLGMENDFVSQVRSNFDGTGAPVTVVIGKPIDFSDLYAQEGRLRTYKRIADRMNLEIAKLGEQDIALRKLRGMPSREVPKPKASEAA